MHGTRVWTMRRLATATLFVSVTAQEASVPITVTFNWEAVMRH